MSHPLVRGSEQVAAAIGEWRSFHDMLVTRLVRVGDTIEMTMHVWRPTAETDSQGVYRDVDHHLVTFHMSDVRHCSLPDPYGPDTLFDLRIEPDGRLVRLTFESVLDRDGEIVCADVTVTTVVPCDSRGETGGRRS